MKRASRLPHWPAQLPAMPAWFRWQLIPKLALALATAGVLAMLVLFHLDYFQVGPNLEQFRAGVPAPREVLATETIQWADPRETARLREEAAQRVPEAASINLKAEVSALEDLDHFFAALSTPTPSSGSQQLPEKLSPEIAASARQLTPEAANRLHASAQSLLRSVMRTRIGEGREETLALLHLDTLARARVHDPGELHILTAILHAVVRPNLVMDPLLTERRRDEARNAVPRVVRVVHAGELILHKGDQITSADLTQLIEKHLLTPAPFTRLLPVAWLILFAVFALGAYLRSQHAELYANQRRLSLLACLLVLPLWANMTMGGHDSEFLVGLLAIPAANMAIAGLLGTPVAIVTTLFTGLTAGLTADHPFPLVLLVIFSSIAGILALPVIWPSRRAWLVVLSLMAINCLLLLGLAGIQLEGGITPNWPAVGSMALWGGFAGLGACIIAVGAIFILARPFGITTQYRLMEMSNANEPLLRRLMEEAPGTYHSSLMVANLAEAAADAIGANALLTRVAALYHDIGKLKRPAFFIENQAPLGVENVHQHLSPRLSYLILISHVRDGEACAQQHRLPAEIINIIREHHGTTLAAYFYHRALNEPGQCQISESDFRYPGPKPSSREAAIVMLSDSVQASVKALKDPTPMRIDSMVDDIITNRLKDGQLDNCEITLRNLRRISEVFVRILSGLYSYTRIEYPELKADRSRLRGNINSESTSTTNEATLLTRSN